MNRTGLYGSTYAEETHPSKACPAATIAIVQGTCKECEANKLACVEDGSDEALVARRWIVESFVEARGYIDSTQDADIITDSLSVIWRAVYL